MYQIKTNPDTAVVGDIWRNYDAAIIIVLLVRHFYMSHDLACINKTDLEHCFSKGYGRVRVFIKGGWACQSI